MIAHVRKLTWLLVLAILAWSAAAAASPADRFAKDASDCINKATPNSVSCSICGVDFSCTNTSCTWGGLKADANQNGQLTNFTRKGYQLYCVNAGGSILASAAPAGLQSRAISSALRLLQSRAEKASYGGSIEYTSIKDAEGATFGIAAPLSYQLTPTFALGGMILAGKAPGLTQFGANLRPLWIIDEERSPGAMRTILTVGTPLQLVVTSGEGLSTGVGYLLGGTVLGGVVTADGTWGAGVSVDAYYASGFQVPALAAVRYSFGDPLRFAIQPAIGADVTAIADTLSGNLLAGVEVGDSIVGLQVFAHGAGNYSFALGISNVSRAIASAAAEKRPRSVTSESPETPEKPLDTEPHDTPTAGGTKREGDLCGAHGECSGSLVCVGGACRTPRRYTPGMTIAPNERAPEAQPGPRGDECKTDGECAGGDVCEAGFCVSLEEAR